MNRDGARARVLHARVELNQAEQQLISDWQPWRDRLGRHRLSLLVGSGLLGGFALAAASPRRWSRVGAALFGGGAWLARSPMGPALLGALWTSILAPSGAPRSCPIAEASPPPDA